MDLKPGCVLRPQTGQDVATAIDLLKDQAIVNSRPTCPLAIRGGGHTPFQGAANVQDGVTIDLRSLNSVDISVDRKTVSVGGGATWGPVDEILDQHNLGVVGGRFDSVGVGGLLTGGGISAFAARFGWSCDNIESYELVNANGTLEEISPTQKPDLLRALKWGSNNFGVITRFKLRAFESGLFWGGEVVYDWSMLGRDLDEFAKVADRDSWDPYAMAIVNLFWTKQGPFFQGFMNLEPKQSNNIRIANLTSFVGGITSLGLNAGARGKFVTLTYRSKGADYPLELVSRLESLTAQLNKTVPGLVSTLTFQMMFPRPYERPTEPNVLGLESETRPLINVLYTMFWDNAADDALMETEMQRHHLQAVELAQEKGVYSSYVYLPYADSWQKPIESYGEEQAMFLRNVSKRHDPSGFYQIAVPGGFKLW